MNTTYEEKYSEVHQRYDEICDKHDIQSFTFDEDEFVEVWEHFSCITNDMLHDDDPDEIEAVENEMIEVAEVMVSHVGRCERCDTMGLDEVQCCDDADYE